MLNVIGDFARKHVLGTVITSLLAGAGTGATVLWSLYEAKVNRVEEMKVKEFQELMAENNNFLEMLSSFTEEIALSGSVDPQKKEELSASLVRLYNGFNAFTVNLPGDQEPPVRELQTSINEVRKRVQLVNARPDLDPLSVALVKLVKEMKVVRPIIEEAVGKPIAPAS